MNLGADPCVMCPVPTGARGASKPAVAIEEPVVQSVDVLRALQDYYKLDRMPASMKLSDMRGLLPGGAQSLTGFGALHAGSSGTFGGETVDFEGPPISADMPTFRMWGRPRKEWWTHYTISYYLATGAPINYVRILLYDPNTDAVDLFEDINPTPPAYGAQIVVDCPPGFSCRVQCGGTSLSGFEVDATWRWSDSGGPPT